MSKITLTIELDNNDAVERSITADRAIAILSALSPNKNANNGITQPTFVPAPLEEEPEEKAVAPKERARKAKKAPEPATPTMDDFDIEDEDDNDDDDDIIPNKTTMEHVRAACQALANAGKSEIVKDCIKKMGVKSLGAIPEDKLGKFLTMLEKATK